MITKSQLRLLLNIIREPEREVSISTLADRLDWSVGHTSRLVSELEARGFVRTSQSGSQKLVTDLDIDPIEQLAALVTEHSHVDFADLVAGSGLEVLYYLDQPRTAPELAEVSAVSRATVYRRLDELQRVGVVGKSESHYRLNEPFSALSSIARGLAHREHRHEAQGYANAVRILWETHAEYLFACAGTVNAENFHLTGLSVFESFDIPLLTRDVEHYFRSKRMASITPADVVCHTLLIDDGPRYRTYCLLLMKKEEIEEETLVERAEHYNLEADIELLTVIDELIDYLRSHGESTSTQLPPWNEFKSSAANYGIEI